MISPSFSGEFAGRSPAEQFASIFSARIPLPSLRAASLCVDPTRCALLFHGRQPIEATEEGPPMAEQCARSDKPGVAMSYPEVLDEMRRLMPLFRKRVPETNNLRQLPQATCDDIRRSGMARILQPARY